MTGKFGTGKPILAGALAFGLLAACGERDVILGGERLDLRADIGSEDSATDAAAANEARAISLGSPNANADWTHRNGGPTHAISHPALAANLTQVFAANIGAGDSRRHRITAEPIVAGGRIFTLDAQSQIVATATSGAALWTRNLTPASDNNRDASGGGMASDGTVVLVTTGFGEVTALDAATGSELWVQDLDAPGTAAPTILGDLAYVVARDGRAWAIELGNGRVRWNLNGTPPVANFSGGAGAAVTSEIAIFPFPSGEVLAAFPEGGLRRWSSVVTGQRPGRASATVSDIAGDPVINGGTVYVGNVSGRMAALRVADGERLWTATEGAVGPVWPVGGSVFLVNDIGELVRLDASDGSAIWRVTLPQEQQRRSGRQRSVTAHYGPVLAGGRLIVAGSDGLIRQYSPESGALLGTLDAPTGAAANPVVAGNTLYVVTKRGQLLAFR